MMIKKTLMLVSLVTALVLSQTAAADNRNHRRGYDGYGSHFRSYNHHNSRHYYSNRYNPYHYGNRRGSSINISYGNHYSRHRNNDAGYFVGGLVLGSLLSYPRYAPQPVERVVYRSAPVVHTREVVVVNRATSSRAPVASGRRLLRDLEGNCFERVVDEDGDEIRVQLDAAECSY